MGWCKVTAVETNPDGTDAHETFPGSGGLTDPFIGREIGGKYRVVRRLGAWGMGAVYKALHLTTGGDVALKFLHGTAVHACSDSAASPPETSSCGRHRGYHRERAAALSADVWVGGLARQQHHEVGVAARGGSDHEAQ